MPAGLQGGANKNNRLAWTIDGRARIISAACATSTCSLLPQSAVRAARSALRDSSARLQLSSAQGRPAGCIEATT